MVVVHSFTVSFSVRSTTVAPGNKQVETREDDSDIMGQDDDRKKALGIFIATCRTACEEGRTGNKKACEYNLACYLDN